eukprot:4082129-Amphidinium_carterae.1
MELTPSLWMERISFLKPEFDVVRILCWNWTSNSSNDGNNGAKKELRGDAKTLRHSTQHSQSQQCGRNGKCDMFYKLTYMRQANPDVTLDQWSTYCNHKHSWSMTRKYWNGVSDVA